MKKDDYLYAEKYRPENIDDCILPKRIKSIFKGYVKNGDFPNLLLAGTSGTGKTTIAKALCKELDYSVIVINASMNGNVDTIRNQIKEFSQTRSLTGQKKAIILDEADGITAVAQGALRGVIEAYPNVRFIFTCNFKNKLMAPIVSRLSLIEFSIKADEKKEMLLEMAKRCIKILTENNVEFDQKVVIEVVKKYYPDNRKILNVLQTYGKGGKIDTGIFAQTTDFEKFVEIIKECSTTNLRQWVLDNLDTEPSYIFEGIYTALFPRLKPENRTSVIPLIAQYQMWSSQVASQEINFVALGMELMNTAEFS